MMPVRTPIGARRICLIAKERNDKIATLELAFCHRPSCRHGGIYLVQGNNSKSRHCQSVLARSSVDQLSRPSTSRRTAPSAADRIASGSRSADKPLVAAIERDGVREQSGDCPFGRQRHHVSPEPFPRTQESPDARRAGTQRPVKPGLPPPYGCG